MSASPVIPQWTSQSTLLAELVEGLTEGLAVCDLEGRVLYTNAFHQRMVGKSAQELLGRVLWELFPSSLGGAFHQAFQRVAAGGPPESFEHHFEPWARWFDNHLSRMPSGLVAVAARDITDRRRAVEGERLRQLLAQATVAIAVIRGPNLVFELANPRYARMVGRTPEQLIGHGFEAAFPSVTPQTETFARLRRVIETGEGFIVEEHRLRFALTAGGGDGLADRYFQVTCEPVRDDTGQGDSILVVAVDITPQVEARLRIEALGEERELLLAREQTSRAESEAANRLKDEFLSTVSHELRTPLTAMLGWVQLLRTRELTPEKRERGLESIERNARAQGQLIEDLLDVSRIMSGKLRLDFETVALSVVVEQALETARPAAELRGIAIEVEPSAAVSVMGDAQRLTQVVWNLLSNAVKFTPPGGRVKVCVGRVGALVTVTVSDNGKGVSAEFLPHLFERFTQAEGGTRRRHGGLGLGLSIVKNLVELHGGEVSASSEGDGEGATFVVTLPRAPVAARLGAVPPGTRRPLAELVGLQVLVADDDDDTREFLRALLESCKAKVTCVSSAAEGLAAVRVLRPRVIISDIGMPGEDGYAFMEQVRALAPMEGGRTPAVALTAYTRKEDRKRAIESGFDEHLSKPVDPEALLTVLVSLAARAP